jgi:hypothetical protein
MDHNIFKCENDQLTDAEVPSKLTENYTKGKMSSILFLFKMYVKIFT